MESILQDACDKAANGNIDAALGLIAAELENNRSGIPDLLFFAGCLFSLNDNLKLGLEYIDLSKDKGNCTELAIRFGQKLFDQAGPRGARMFQFFSQQRLWPKVQLAHLVPLGIKQHNKIEPWYFSRKQGAPFPDQKRFNSGVTSELVRDACLKGWLPSEPSLTKRSKILTIGSCFAEELRNYFLTHDISSEIVFVPPGLNNTYALKSFFNWIETGTADDEDMWYEQADNAGGVVWRPDEERHSLLTVFGSLDCVVMTIGLAEIWEDVERKTVFWRGVPRSIYNAEKHVCRVSSVEENVVNLESALRSLKVIAPKAQVIISLSPVPLKATQTGFSCVTADCLSKSILRVAISNVVEKKQDHVHYWPSFEIVRWLSGHVGKSFFGEDGNARHVNRFAVELILNEFVSAYFISDTPEVERH